MASIALSVVGCIDYLAHGTIFTCVMFLPKKKVIFFFSARKAADERWGVVSGASPNIDVSFVVAARICRQRV